MEKLQNGDRFYYLQRLDGLHLFGEMENNSFAAMIMRNTDATHLPSDVFSTPGLILEVDQTKQFNDLDGDGDAGERPIRSAAASSRQLVIRDNPATPGADTNYLRYTGDDHVVLGGTDAGNDILIASIGDDTLYGDGGNDRLEGGFGNDIINGGAGDDIITRHAAATTTSRAATATTSSTPATGLDLVIGGDGKDFIVLGTDMGSEVFAGDGNDFIYGNKNAERILGNEGNDWIETGTFDGAPGDNFDEIFAHDGIDGHDVFLGDGGFDEFIGEGGDDIMVGSPGRGKMAGMSGFDWATYKDNAVRRQRRPVHPDRLRRGPDAAAERRARRVRVGGRPVGHEVQRRPDGLRTTWPQTRCRSLRAAPTGFRGSALDAEGIALIDGPAGGARAPASRPFDAGDIILGGDGSDIIKGHGGDDIIDGDKWLDVQIGVFAPTMPTTPARRSRCTTA